jgi:hypothetical protein
MKISCVFILAVTFFLNGYSSQVRIPKYITYRYDLRDSLNQEQATEFNSFANQLFEEIQTCNVRVFNTFLMNDALPADLLKCRMRYLSFSSSSQARACGDYENCHLVEMCPDDRDSIDFMNYREMSSKEEYYGHEFKEFNVLEIQYIQKGDMKTPHKITFYMSAVDPDNVYGGDYPIVSLYFEDIYKTEKLNSSGFLKVVEGDSFVVKEFVGTSNKQDNKLYYFDEKCKEFKLKKEQD